jgi:hypothetical protein
MKIDRENSIYAERIWVGMKKAELFIRKFEIRVELRVRAGIGFLFSDKSFHTYFLIHGDLLLFLKKLEKELKNYENDV